MRTRHQYEIREGQRWCVDHQQYYKAYGQSGRLRCPICTLGMRSNRASWTKQRGVSSQFVTAFRKFKAYQVLGGCCAMCGETDPTVLEFDHISGNGRLHVRERGGSTNHDWVLKHQEEAKETLQLLCANCHARKHSFFNSIEGVFDFPNKQRVGVRNYVRHGKFTNNQIIGT